MPQEKLPDHVKNVDVLSATYELAELMKQDASGLERKLLRQADMLLEVVEDLSFVPISSQNSFELKDLKQEIIDQVIDDISAGVVELRTKSLGIFYDDKTLRTFAWEHHSVPFGNIVYRIRWCNFVDYQSSVRREDFEISQDELNLAIYRLASELAQLI